MSKDAPLLFLRKTVDKCMGRFIVAGIRVQSRYKVPRKIQKHVLDLELLPITNYHTDR